MSVNKTSKKINHRFSRCLDGSAHSDDREVVATFFAFVHHVMWCDGKHREYSDGTVVVDFGKYHISKNCNEYIVSLYGHAYQFNENEADR